MFSVILEQACQVEVQTIVVQQASSILGSFSQDLGRQNSKQPSFDQQISSLLGEIVNSDGSLSSSNLGFSGKNVGNSSVSVGGNNWNNNTSPASVESAKKMAQQAANVVSTFRSFALVHSDGNVTSLRTPTPTPLTPRTRPLRPERGSISSSRRLSDLPLHTSFFISFLFGLGHFV